MNVSDYEKIVCFICDNTLGYDNGTCYKPLCVPCYLDEKVDEADEDGIDDDFDSDRELHRD